MVDSTTALPSERSMLGAFLTGVWLNRRYTRLSSSIILGLMVSAVFLAMIWIQLPLYPRAAPGLLAMLVANTLFYPAAREGYYRATQPVREGLGGIFLIGLLAIIGFIVRLMIFLLLWFFAVPLGVLSSLYLGIAEVRGYGWRIQP